MLQKGTESCNVVMCAAFTGWGDEGKWKGLQKYTDSCNVVMCAAGTVWGRRWEMESVTESY